jgi:hypothetical protein
MIKRNRRRPAPTQDGTISTVSVVLTSEQQVSAQLGPETMILHLADGIYYGLDEVGTTIWNLIHEPRTVAEIRDRICEEYDVGPSRCERELIRFLRQLSERRLIELPQPMPHP